MSSHINRDNFCPIKVQSLLTDHVDGVAVLPPEELTRLLSEACHVVHRLQNQMDHLKLSIKNLQAQ